MGDWLEERTFKEVFSGEHTVEQKQTASVVLHQLFPVVCCEFFKSVGPWNLADEGSRK